MKTHGIAWEKKTPATLDFLEEQMAEPAAKMRPWQALLDSTLIQLSVKQTSVGTIEV